MYLAVMTSGHSRYLFFFHIPYLFWVSLGPYKYHSLSILDVLQ